MPDKVVQTHLASGMLSASMSYIRIQPAQLFWYPVHTSKDSTTVKFPRKKVARNRAPQMMDPSSKRLMYFYHQNMHSVAWITVVKHKII